MTDLSRRKFFKIAGAVAVIAATPKAVSQAAAFLEDQAGPWAVADGGSLPIKTCSDLFAVMGRTYGGDEKTFKLPNLCAFVGTPAPGAVPFRWLIKVKEDGTAHPVGSVLMWAGAGLPRTSNDKGRA